MAIISSSSPTMTYRFFFRAVQGVFLVLLATVLLAGCAGRDVGTSSGGQGLSRSEGMATYYAKRYNGRRTASGERFDSAALTAAHQTLPFGTRVRVTNRDNGRQVVVRINDRGPFTKGRIIDLSPAAARRLGMIRSGVATVHLDILH